MYRNLKIKEVNWDETCGKCLKYKTDRCVGEALLNHPEYCKGYILEEFKQDEMLEKQIPKKVFDNGYEVYFCPNCKGSVWQIKDESKYCFRCGQKLQWS
jgi:hypothetical protein